MRRVGMKHLWVVTMAVGLIVSSGAVFSQDIGASPEFADKVEHNYSPYVGRHFPLRVFWGDTHLHTSYSTDAGMAGNTVGPEDAYRFAKGEMVMTSTGQKAQLKRPLDFLVIADHAENLGLAPFIEKDDPTVLANPQGKLWHDMVKNGEGYDAFIEWVAAMNTGKDPMPNEDMVRGAWYEIIEAAERNNQPGAFTALIGFEWTSAPGGNNLHRNVLFRDGADVAKQVVPFSLYDSEDPEDLWRWMENLEETTGGRVLAIPHNGNLSNGLMFADVTVKTKRPLDAEYARRRAEWEPVVEVTQPKGTGEAHPFLSPDDGFADFELIDKGNLSGSAAKTRDMLQYEYSREALKRGLAYEATLGTNPFKFGMIGSTDAHGGLASTEEENWWGKANIVEPSAERYKDVLIKSLVDDSLSIQAVDLGASGLAAVWARENSRESIWDAFKRREVYGTTGGRMVVRVFAGWDFEPEEISLPDFAAQGYARGVPMGGDLSAAPVGTKPRFLIRAMRDPDGANLDRIQVIKGWIDAAGEVHERIFDVAVSDGREIGPDGRCTTPVGNTVDVANASFTNTIGDALLGAYWEDPTFDPSERAFYYVRVIEIPKPRWTAYDQKFYGITMPEGTRLTVQDRAYTSPIWYTP
ncbi:MAG: DUF3604 domain-containing protein [Acidobacteria bacterium]|nr:DUF3604 domain-containing protein [Acidobacteriota bacterium]